MCGELVSDLRPFQCEADGVSGGCHTIIDSWFDLVSSLDNVTVDDRSGLMWTASWCGSHKCLCGASGHTRSLLESNVRGMARC